MIDRRIPILLAAACICPAVAQSQALRDIMPPPDSLGVAAGVIIDAPIGRQWTRAFRLDGGLLVATALAFTDSGSAQAEVAKLRSGGAQRFVDSLLALFMDGPIAVTESGSLDLRLGDVAAGAFALLDIGGQSTRGMQIMIARGRVAAGLMLVTGNEALTRERLIDLARSMDRRMARIGDVDPVPSVALVPAVTPMPPLPDVNTLADGMPEDSGVFSQRAVDVAPVLLGASIDYPPELRQAGRQGWVVMGFVVGREGRAEPESIRILAVSDSVFITAARATVEGAVYRPGEIDGEAVRVQVVQPVVFQLRPEERPPGDPGEQRDPS